MSKKWESGEEAVLRRHYYDMPWPELLKLLPGRSQTAIFQRARSLGLIRFNTGGFQNNPEAVAKGAKYRYRKGLKPHNKGKKQQEFMSAESIARTAKTRFQQGHLPHNTKHDGHISIRKDSKTGAPYIHVRTALGKYEYLHRLVWAKHFGPIPKGHCIAFKDGNTLNPAPDNLECISRAENMKRNTLHRYRELDPELYKAIYALIGLKESITAKKQKEQYHD